MAISVELPIHEQKKFWNYFYYIILIYYFNFLRFKAYASGHRQRRCSAISKGCQDKLDTPLWRPCLCYPVNINGVIFHPWKKKKLLFFPDYPKCEKYNPYVNMVYTVSTLKSFFFLFRISNDLPTVDKIPSSCAFYYKWGETVKMFHPEALHLLLITYCSIFDRHWCIKFGTLFTSHNTFWKVYFDLILRHIFLFWP